MISTIAKVLLAVNGLVLLALADPTIQAVIAAHPKAAVVAMVVSNIAHLVAKFAPDVKQLAASR